MLDFYRDITFNHFCITETQLIESSNSNQQNLLERRPNFDKVVAISGTLKNPQDRFLMIGGPAGFLSVLEQHKIKADVKTFSQMLSLVGNAEDDEEALITEMKRRGVAVDTGFMNQLLKKRCLRCLKNSFITHDHNFNIVFVSLY